MAAPNSNTRFRWASVGPAPGVPVTRAHSSAPDPGRSGCAPGSRTRRALMTARGSVHQAGHDHGHGSVKANSLTAPGETGTERGGYTAASVMVMERWARELPALAGGIHAAHAGPLSAARLDHDEAHHDQAHREDHAEASAGSGETEQNMQAAVFRPARWGWRPEHQRRAQRSHEQENHRHDGHVSAASWRCSSMRWKCTRCRIDQQQAHAAGSAAGLGSGRRGRRRPPARSRRGSVRWHEHGRLQFSGHHAALGAKLHAGDIPKPYVARRLANDQVGELLGTAQVRVFASRSNEHRTRRAASAER